MDEYGFSSAATLAIELHDLNSRNSGRTMRIIERAQDGDLIVTTNRTECGRIARILQERGKVGVGVRVIHVGDDPLARQGTLTKGRVWFDHLWVRDYYTVMLRVADRQLEGIQKAISKTWPEDEEAFLRDRRREIEAHPLNRERLSRGSFSQER